MDIKTFTPLLLLVLFFCVHRLVDGGIHQQGAFQDAKAGHRTQWPPYQDAKTAKGSSAKMGRFPYMCSIRQRGSRSFVCSGFLIDPEWVITSASCVDTKSDILGLDPLVYCGKYTKDDWKAQRFFTSEGVMHPKWNGDYKNGFDIALLNLDRKTNWTLPDINKRPIYFPQGKPLYSLDWRQRPLLPTLTTDLVSVEKQRCQKQSSFKIKDDMICAEAKTNGTLEGYPSGLLLIPDKGVTIDDGLPQLDFILGIASGPVSTDSNAAYIYTSIGHYRDWIQQVTEGKIVDTAKGECSSSLLYLKSKAPTKRRVIKHDTPTTTPSYSPSAISPEPSADDFDEFDEMDPKTAFEDIKSDNAASLKILLSEGLDLDSGCKDLFDEDNGDTLLHCAARFNAGECAKLLIDSGADVNATNDYRQTPLHISSTFDSLSVAKILLSHGAEVDVEDNGGSTPLHIACSAGSLAVAKLLIENGSNIEAVDEDRFTPLHHAASMGQLAIAKLLLEEGAFIEVKTEESERPLHLACESGHLNLVKLLVEKGAFIETKTKDKLTPLHYACIEGHVPIIQYLLEKGADIKAKDDDKREGMHLACSNGHLDVVKFLVEKGASVKEKGYYYYRPMHDACEGGHLDIVKFLIEKGASIEPPLEESYESTPMILACERDHLDVTKFLIEKGADIEAKHEHSLKMKALHLTSKRGEADFVKYLLKKGAKPNAIDRWDRTPLHLVCYYGHGRAIETAKALLDAGANTTVADEDHNTPYEAICEASESECDSATERGLMKLLRPKV